MGMGFIDDKMHFGKQHNSTSIEIDAMRTIIAGSRGITDYNIVEEAIEQCGWIPTLIISGTANGVDKLGETWASVHDVQIERYPANWYLYGRHAGYLRNVEMAENADCCICIWDGKSRGTKMMIDIAKRKRLMTFVYTVKN